MSDDAATPGWGPASGHGDEVRYAVDGSLGRILLNRPRAITALDRASVDSLLQQLTAWAADDAVAAVVIEGAGERGVVNHALGGEEHRGVDELVRVQGRARRLRSQRVGARGRVPAVGDRAAV